MCGLIRAPLSVGDRFLVTVPLPRRGGRQPDDDGRLELDRIRVLLADDHEEMLDRVAKLLGTDYDVVDTVRDGRQALEAARKLKPDVLVLDISMPVINGIETAHQLKQAGSKTRVIFLTVHDDPDYAREALETGALGYVIKSRIASDLVAAVNEVHAGRSFVSPLSPPQAIS